ncbi:MAG: outer membrane lipoprotein carrier protein LolA [Elusimicrobia bacterium]|nr:outer membrane lipoprotein carrier protein LolA [Elusimicrobiota bacterium]
MRLAALAAALLLLPAAASARPRRKAPRRAKATARKIDAKAAEKKAAAASDGTALPVWAASTAPVTLDLVKSRFAALDAKIVTLKADFRQFVNLDGSDTTQEVAGAVLFQKPDLMRLTHTLPEAQTVVSDGTWLWVYRPSTGQAIKTRLEDWRRREPLAKGLLDFGRSADLLERYAAEISTVSAPGPDGYRTFVVALTPKPGKAGPGGDFRLTLKASTKDFFPAESTLRVGHASIRSEFSAVRLNPVLPPETFHFTPPPGADVFTAPSR